MSLPLPQRLSIFAAAPRPFASPRANALRVVLVAGTLIAIALAAALSTPSATALADVELAFVLRGMALIKAALVLLALALVGWRLGRSTPIAVTTAYLAGVWLMACAAMLVWQLSAIAAAALVFHVGEITLLLVAWRDRGGNHEKEQQIDH